MSTVDEKAGPGGKQHIERVMRQVGSSVDFDYRLAASDLACTATHVRMLERQERITQTDCAALLDAIEAVAGEVSAGRFVFDPELEDVHTNLDAAVSRRAGASADWLGLGRARNDLAPTALRLWLRDHSDELLDQLIVLVGQFTALARHHHATVMPGMTHLQAAQPISFGHQCMAYAHMFFRDAKRLRQTRIWLNESPLGSGALAGVTMDNDRHFQATQLGFTRPTDNALDSVSDRDFVLDFLSTCATAAIHASRLTEDLLIWLTPQFNFIDLPEFLASRSSVMPHKKNADALELVRAKAGRVIGNLNTVQIMLKGLTLSYCRDMQEDKEAVFDTADAMSFVFDVLQLVVAHVRVNEHAMYEAAEKGFTTSTDYVDWLVTRLGLPFKRAYQLVGGLVALAQQEGVPLSDLQSKQRMHVDVLLESISDWPRITARDAMQARISFGGTAPNRVLEAADAMQECIDRLREQIANEKSES
jgi:argininosuccinate lyase